MQALVPVSRKALVVEDDPHIRSMMVTMLRRAGFDTTPAEDGQQAIERLGEVAFDLIVLDLAMPHVTGYDVVAFLKDRLPRTLKRIIITTAATSALQHPFPEEICTLLAKPFDMNEFITYATFCADDTATRVKRQASFA